MEEYLIALENIVSQLEQIAALMQHPLIGREAKWMDVATEKRGTVCAFDHNDGVVLIKSDRDENGWRRLTWVRAGELQIKD